MLVTSPTPSLPNLTRDWHACSADDTLKILGSDADRGLNAAEVEARSRHYGPNELRETIKRTRWEIFLDQFSNIMLLMLIAVAIVAGILDFLALQSGSLQSGIPFKDTAAILVIVILNGILGYVQEVRAEAALAALKKMASSRVRVVRDGEAREIDAPELVPGDILLVEAGVQLAADGQLLEASNLQIRESALTGESEAANKHATTPLAPDTPLGDRVNMVFSGTEVVQGRGKIIITGTGMATELGKIAEMIQGVENEKTPLQKRMTQLGNVLVTGSLILVALVIAIGILRAGNWSPLRELVEISLSMAVAVVPEGLPAVITVTLALGTQRMVRRNALIRKLPAVETLGSVNTICSDKTGTLTQNKMIVREVETLGGSVSVKGEGYEPVGDFCQEGEAIATQDRPELQALLVAAVLCNDSLLRYEENEWHILGDPTEGSLLALAGKAGLEQESLKSRFQRVAELPFSSERKRMSVICLDNEYGESYSLFSKGSPEMLLGRCQEYQLGNETEILTPDRRHAILNANNQMAARGLRVLGFAYKVIDELPHPKAEEDPEQEMIWLGLTGAIDAPRPEVSLAVQHSKEAGIRPIMITGDHPLTARAIAKELGIADENTLTLTGQELEKLSQQDLELEVERASVYARVSPEHKLRIVRALQARNCFVAMTGDGVNDAPALKQADIGIAMGITGTDVSKEASDMVLLDDNFATIVAATEEGRVVYTNIRRFIKYILGSNVGEVITIASAPILGLSGVPLTPLQILWMNLVTDGLPALALAVEPASPDVMKQPPHNPNESIFARGLGSYIVRIGIIFSIFSITLMLIAYHESLATDNPESWKTMVFTTLCLAQMGHAIAARSFSRLTIEMNWFGNPSLLWAVLVTTALQLAIVYVPFLRDFFGTQVLTAKQLGICLGFSSLMFVWVEMEKLFVRSFLQGRRKI
ncbi:MAG: cation-translocating P-type ATPase [Cyanobacteria bacterium SBLK]|nr:cation-translocating P-type ATPase [Cyanobacteria bacterium SBLK]